MLKLVGVPNGFRRVAVGDRMSNYAMLGESADPRTAPRGVGGMALGSFA
jgi:hypothetical protein